MDGTRRADHRQQRSSPPSRDFFAKNMNELLIKFPAFFEECRPQYSKSFTIDDSINHDDDNDVDLLTKSAVFHAITLHEANALIGRVVSAYQARPRKEPMHEKS
jgi:hypothetical protein